MKIKSVHFVLHHSVVCKNHETSKLRTVFDGSAQQNVDELSLNKHKGPDCIPSLFDVLVKFKADIVALITDVEKVFLQIQINMMIVTCSDSCGLMM